MMLRLMDWPTVLNERFHEPVLEKKRVMSFMLKTRLIEVGNDNTIQSLA